MKKIACVGTHSVGKSTLCYQLAEEAKRDGKSVHIIQERVRFSPFPINDEMNAETAIWACTNQISKELEASTRGFDLIISDRSPLDTFFYARYFDLIIPYPLENFAKRWTNKYDKIYFVRPDSDHVPSSDGVRSTDYKFMHCVDLFFDEYFCQYPGEIQTITTKEIFR